MKLSCLQENLNRGLNIVGRGVPGRATLPITQNVLLKTEGSRLRLTTTDMEMAITTWIGAKIDEEGAITIPAQLLTDFIHSLDNDKVELTLLPKSKTVEFKCARAEARIAGVDAADFPALRAAAGGFELSVRHHADVRAVVGEE